MGIESNNRGDIYKLKNTTIMLKFINKHHLPQNSWRRNDREPLSHHTPPGFQMYSLLLSNASYLNIPLLGYFVCDVGDDFFFNAFKTGDGVVCLQ